MAFTEEVMANQPGIIFACLDNGDMVMDRDSGDFVPADQVIHDWDHIEKIDALDQDGLGSLRFYVEPNETMDDYEEDDDEIRSDFPTYAYAEAPLYTQRAEPDISTVQHNAYGGMQNSRTVSVRKQSSSRHKRGKIRDLM